MLIVPPTQTGVLLDGVGKPGIGFITTVVVPVFERQPLEDVAVTLYTPAFAAVTFVMLGFCKVLVKPFGPDQA